MRKVSRQTDKIIGELLHLRESRKSIDDFNFSFLANFADNCRVMHSFIGEDDKKLLDITIRQYFVFLVSCWETFFRDLFVYIYTRDSGSTERLIEKLKVNEELLDLSKITLPELLSKSFNFQNIDDLESAYNSMWGSDFMESVCNTETEVCGINGKVVSGFSISSLFGDWHSTISEVFDIRHKVIHDANYRPARNVSFVQKAEALFFTIPQMATFYVAKRFSFKRVVWSNGVSSVPYIFNINEINADDWVIIN